MHSQVIDLKQDIEMQDIAHTEKINRSADEDYMYMKVIVHFLWTYNISNIARPMSLLSDFVFLLLNFFALGSGSVPCSSHGLCDGNKTSE